MMNTVEPLIKRNGEERRRTLRSAAAGFLTLFLCFAGAPLLNAQDYWREMIRPEQIQRMNQFERVQYTKARKLLNDQQYKAAATEFERFLIQYKDSDMLPYMIFFRAFSLHQARNRNQAISVYNEVVDFYGGEINAAAPALYYRGIAQFDNGDYAKGMLSMKEILDDEDYVLHPVAASAALQIVRNHWKNKEPEKAERYLKLIYENFRENSKDAASRAKNYYIASLLANARLRDAESWYFQLFRAEEEKKKTALIPETLRVRLSNDACGLLLDNYHWNFVHDDLLEKYRSGKNKSVSMRRTLWDYLSERRGDYEKLNDLWGYYSRAIRVNAGEKLLSKNEFEKLVAEAVKFVGGVPDDDKNKGRMQNRYKYLINQLIDTGRFEQAIYVNARLASPKERAWNESVILIRREQWEDAVKQLDSICANFKDDADLVRSSLWNKGDILRERLKRYEESIKVYRSIAEPPRTLWAIADAQKRMGDTAAAIASYVEIENAFPDSGPQAAWARAEYYRNLGNREMAIKEGRHIMKKFPKSQQSSWAHQLLEGYGIDETGGGVADEEF